MKIKLAGFGLLAVAGALLTACSPGSPSTSASNAAQTQPTPGASASSTQDSTAGDCLLGANGADVEVGIANPTSTCSQWVQNLAGTGLVWSYISQMVPPGQPGTADQETMQQACDLTANSGEELYVEDAGGQTYGNSICSSEEQNGWTPETSPGPLAAIMQGIGQQHASANASASAAAQQQQMVNQEQSSLANDISTLNSDANSLNTNNALAGDINSMKSDYQTEQNDYGTEQSDYQAGGCTQASGDADTVGGDADTVGGDQDTLNGDIQTIQNDISGLQTGIQNVNSDVSALKSNGASPAQSPSSALAGGQKAVSNANAAIKWAQGQGNTIKSEAQQLATTAQNYMSQHGC